jgi:hypothetical protein
MENTTKQNKNQNQSSASIQICECTALFTPPSFAERKIERKEK